jgi:hypothetical protein
MTPFDRDPPALLKSAQGDILQEYGDQPRPVDPGEPIQAPNDPGDEIERQQKRIHELEAEVKRYRNRERQMRALIEQYNSLIRATDEWMENPHWVEDPRRPPHGSAPYPEGLGGVGACDCTMDRGSLLTHDNLRVRIERAILSMAKG